MRYDSIQVVPLGAGQDVGRSCILVTMGGYNIMLDCGMHMGYQDARRFPDFSYISGKGRLTDYLDCVIISHFHLDHCGALPHMTEIVGYDGPLYMTYPTKAICPVLLEDYRKVQTEFRGDRDFFTSQHVKQCIKKVTAVNLHEVIQVDENLSIRAFYAGHVLGAAMFEVRVRDQSILYTGDFNMTPDRHLGAARVLPGLNPDLLISESTYATTIRDSKRARERDFLKKVLIPVFALGRAQELYILLESYWERMGLKVPVYYSLGLAEKANMYYRLFINWTNENIKTTCADRNMFEFKHIKPFDQSYANEPGPMVLLSSPGMLHGGQSLRVFKMWCHDPKNLIIMPGFCVAGTLGAKVIAGSKKEMIEGKMYDINLQVEYMSFSAHADAKGIMQLIRDCNAKNVMFVHGEAAKMEFLKGKVEKEFGLQVFNPANGVSISLKLEPNRQIHVPKSMIERSLSLDPSPGKRNCPFEGCLVLNKVKNTLRIVSFDDVAEHFGFPLHHISYSQDVKTASGQPIAWQKLATALMQFDAELQVKNDGIELFHGEVSLVAMPKSTTELEFVWDESRDRFKQPILDVVNEVLGNAATATIAP